MFTICLLTQFRVPNSNDRYQTGS